MSFQSQIPIICPAKIGTASVKPAASRYNSVNPADIVSQFSTMAISDPIKGANSTSPVVTKPQPKSLSNVFTAKGVSASQRIQERRKLVAAKLNLPTKRPKRPIPPPPPSSPSPPPPTTAVFPASRYPPTKIPQFSAAPTSATKSTSTSSRASPTPRAYGWVQVELGQNFRQGTPAARGLISAFVTIPDHTFDSDSLIPSSSSGRRPFAIQYPLPTFEPVFLPLRPSGSIRGSAAYRPRTCKGRCRGDRLPCSSCQIQPATWASTPSEADVVDPTRVRKVQFAPKPRVRYFAKWYRDAYWLRSDHSGKRYRSYIDR